MDITEVRVKLMEDPHERLQAFCSVTFDFCFVVRDLKIIQGTKGSFVAMPSRKLTDRCPKCYMKNHLRAMHCNQCGAKLDVSRATKDTDGRAKLYADIAHPIKSECRELIQSRVLEAFEEELIRSEKPNYICSYDDYGEESFATLKGEQPDNPVEPMVAVTILRDGEPTRRIEPMETQPSGPHHSQSAQVNGAERSQPVKTDASLAQSASNEDDGFGVGIV